MYIIESGGRSGTFTKWYENGQRHREETYKNNEKDGVWIAWDETGQKQSETTYENGKILD